MNLYAINIVALVADFIIICLCFLNPFMKKLKKKHFIIITIVYSLISITSILQCLIRDNNVNEAYVYLNIIQGITLSITPLLPFLILLISHKVENKKTFALLCIPYVINSIFCIVSIFIPLVFQFNPDLSYVYAPCYFVPILVGCYSLVIVILFIVKYIQYNSLSELMFLIAIFALCSISLALELTLKMPYLFYTMASISLLGYYGALMTIDIRKDTLSNTFNRNYLNFILTSLDKKKNAVLIMYDCNGLKQINDTLGHSFGDKLIEKTGYSLLAVYGKIGRVYRFGGDEFLVIITNEKYFSEVNNLMTKFNEQAKAADISIAGGYVMYNKDESIQSALDNVDSIMYENKRIMKGE